MVWFIFGIMLWGVFMVLVTPLVKKEVTSPAHTAEIDTYKAEIERLSKEIDETGSLELEGKKVTLQRQLLELTKSGDGSQTPKLLVINSLAALFIFGGIGLYATLGSPELAQKDNLQFEAANPRTPSGPDANAVVENDERVEEMLARLKTDLAGDQRENAEAWVLYARTLMNIGRYDEALKAYEELVKVTDSHPRAVKEYELAQDYAAQYGPNAEATPGPTREDIEAAAGLSPQERNAMITSMVEGLSAKLQENPKDPGGWIRLLRARKHLGQKEIAKREVDLLRSTYIDDPEQVANILSKAGWED